MPKNTAQCPRPGLEHRVELSALTMRPPHLPCLTCTSTLHCQEFEDYKDADDAVYEMNHKEFMGERYMYDQLRAFFPFLLFLWGFIYIVR